MKVFLFIVWVAMVSACQLVAAKPLLVIVAAESEYQTSITVPDMCKQNLGEQFDVKVVRPDEENRHVLVGADTIAKADVLLLSVWRTALPASQLQLIRKHVADGKPIVAIRTASHGFALRANMEKPDGHDTWDAFDAEVLGGNYHSHGPSTKGTAVHIVKTAKSSPLIRGVEGKFTVRS